MALTAGVINSFRNALQPRDHARFTAYLRTQGREWLTKFGYTFTEAQAESLGYARAIWEESNATPSKVKSIADGGGLILHDDFNVRLMNWTKARNEYLREYAESECALTKVTAITEDVEVPLEGGYLERKLKHSREEAQERVQLEQPKRGKGRRFSKAYQPRWRNQD